MQKLIPIFSRRQSNQVEALRERHPQLLISDAAAVAAGRSILYQDTGIGCDFRYFTLEDVGPYLVTSDLAPSAETTNILCQDQGIIIQRLRGVIERMFSDWGTGTDVRELHKLAAEVAHAYQPHRPVKKIIYTF